MSLLKSATIPRIAALDLMRGYFLIAIILNHLHYWPSGYDWLTARGELFVSSAEGFFLISGIVLGIVRGRKLLEKPWRVGAQLLAKRSLQIYITYIILTIGFTLAGWQFIDNSGLKQGIAPVDTTLLSVVWQTISFQYLYGWADYLRLYAIFIIIAPLFLLLLRKNLWWIGVAASILIWGFTPTYTWPENIYWQPLNWQLLFFAGLTIGFHWPELTRFWQSRSKLVRQSTITLILASACATLAYNVFLAFGGYISSDVYAYVGPMRDLLHTNYFDKENLPIARLVLFGIWFWASFWLFNHFRRVITKYLGWILIPFGTNSLYVYTVHAFIIFGLHLLLPAGSTDLLLNLIVTTLVIGLIWVMVRYRVLFRIIPR